MKRMAFVVLAGALAVLVSSGTAGAGGRFGGRQGPFGGGQPPTLLLALPPGAAVRLELTGEQKMKLDGLRMRMAEDLRKAFPGGAAGGGGNFREAAQKAQETLRKAETDAEALLTPSQKTPFDALKTEYQGYAGAGRAALAVLAVTGLKDEQKRQLKTLATEAQGKRRGLFQGGGGGGNLQGAFRKLQELDAAAETGIRKILTADQVKQFDEALKAMPQPMRRLRRPGANPP